MLIGRKVADRQQTCSKRLLTKNERRATRRTGLLRVHIGKQRAFVRYGVNVWRFITHATTVIGAGIPDANIISPHDKNIGFARRH